MQSEMVQCRKLHVKKARNLQLGGHIYHDPMYPRDGTAGHSLELLLKSKGIPSTYWLSIVTSGKKNFSISISSARSYRDPDHYEFLNTMSMFFLQLRPEHINDRNWLNFSALLLSDTLISKFKSTLDISFLFHDTEMAKQLDDFVKLLIKDKQIIFFFFAVICCIQEIHL